MFRIVRVSATRLQGRYHGGSSRLYRTIRYYSKEQQRSELCPPPPPKKTHTGTALTFGALALAGGAIIGYAKYDPDFRCHLVEFVPFTDDVIKFVFQEDRTYAENLSDWYASLKHAIYSEEEDDHKKKKKRKVTETDEDYKLDPKQDPEIPPTHPKNLADLEKSTTETAKAAIEAYNKAINALINYAADIEIIIDEAGHNIDKKIWASLKEKSEAKERAVQMAEKEALRATKDHQKMKELLKQAKSGVPDSVKLQAERNIEELSEDIQRAKKTLADEMRRTDITEKYWQKVQEARKHFGDELETLFPNIDLKDKKMNIKDGDLDLFVLHAMGRVLYYQKELHKLETVGSERLQRAVEAAKKGGLEVLTTEQICNELQKEKRLLEDEFNKKCLRLRQETETELRRQLRMQSEAFADHLNDAVKVKEAEVEKRLIRNFDEKVLEERCSYKEQLAGMIGRLRGLDQAIRARSELDKAVHQSQVLWAACQSLYRAVKAGCPGFPWNEQLRPLNPEIKAIKLAAADNDELVKNVLEGIPNVAKNRGVYPEDALRERFLKVEKIARGVALVPEHGGRLHMYLLSYLQSFLLLKAANPIPQSELNDNETDFSKLSTNDILQRARYWLDRGDFSQTLKYMNLLQGAPRAVARQWMEETKIMLETQQAAATLMAHATASGLMHL
ncbi:hypothetical protein AMK59_8514 [Oryctes borbonicus]|uniref:MICOS complex subunit MIC60 n=1 Tax=Oryctes borbonicus TaxID=1629725 RepID=A0A0T6AW33_9SCAR|nr:hypothetical protein AMK59_8514 [Oryctes borbonicus]